MAPTFDAVIEMLEPERTIRLAKASFGGAVANRGAPQNRQPVFTLASQGALNGFNKDGATWAFVSGTLGAVGALFIIFAFKTGGLPAYVMPLVFGGAPLVNVLVSMWIHPPKNAPSPLLYVGFLVTAAGAGMVLYFKPAA